MSEEKILNKYIELINKGYCCACNELNCIDNFPHKKIVNAISNLQQENQQLKEKINTYENPEDLTLMFMYCDEKAKDKIKQLKEVIEEVRHWLSSVIAIEKTLPFYEDIKRADVNELLQILDKVKEN